MSTLTWRCRAASEEQLASVLRTSVTRVHRVCRQLSEQEMIRSQAITVAAYELAGPLVSFKQGQRSPQFGPLAWQLRKRWREVQRRYLRVVWATRKATHLVGGVGGTLRQPLQLDHDLGVTEILARRSRLPGETWISEDVHRAWHDRTGAKKIPDAVIINAEDRIRVVIEFGGQYSRGRLEAFHRYWAGRASYEIW